MTWNKLLQDAIDAHPDGKYIHFGGAYDGTAEPIANVITALQAIIEEQQKEMVELEAHVVSGDLRMENDARKIEELEAMIQERNDIFGGSEDMLF